MKMSWLRGLLSEIGLYIEGRHQTPILFGDNQSTQKLTETGIKSERTKHIDVKYRFVTDEVLNGRVRLQWVPTAQQVADVLTKALGAQQHQILIDRLMA